MGCPPNGPFDNGAPIPGGVAVSVDWLTRGVGDSFFVYSDCGGTAPYVTSLQYFVTSVTRQTLPSTLTTRVVFFAKISGFVVGDWTGPCTVARAPSIGAPGGTYVVSCDFVHKGTSLSPSACDVPTLAPDASYEVLFSSVDAAAYGVAWLSSMPDPGSGCVLRLGCAFSQQMAAAQLPRVDLCRAASPTSSPIGGNAFSNFAFRLGGTAFKPVRAGCPS